MKRFYQEKNTRQKHSCTKQYLQQENIKKTLISIGDFDEKSLSYGK